VVESISDLEHERRRWLALVSAFAIIAIGRALQITNGVLDSDALLWITVPLATAVVGVLVSRPAALARIDAFVVLLLGIAGLLANLAQLYTKPPILVDSLSPRALAAFNWRLAALSVIAAAAMIRSSARSVRLLQIGALVAAHFALGVWTIHHSPAPTIDVHVFQRDAIAALRHGTNPYGLTFPNIYDDGAFYGPGLAVRGRLHFGYPYFPLSLLLAMPGQLLAGDHRYAQLVALELAAVLMAFTRPNGFGVIAAVLFLTTPRIFFVLQQAWTEPFVVFGLAALVYVAVRNTRVVPWLFGMFVGLKQYLVLAVPSALLLMRDRREMAGWLIRAAIACTASMLPFILWNPRAFWKSVVALQFHQPFRMDALSYLSWWAAAGHPPPSTAVSFVAASIAAAVSLWRLPRTPAGFASAVALTLFVFIAFNKQAFCNYYFAVIGAFAVALAACARPEDR
jgi:hypothetical protein